MGRFVCPIKQHSEKSPSGGKTNLKSVPQDEVHMNVHAIDPCRNIHEIRFREIDVYHASDNAG